MIHKNPEVEINALKFEMVDIGKKYQTALVLAYFISVKVILIVLQLFSVLGHMVDK